LAEVSTNGVTLAYDDAGAGPHTFVFIHGWACDRTFWQPQFEDLSRDQRCINVDLRGRGASPAVAPYDSTTASDDVAGLIRALDLGPCIIVGHSLGGLVALLLNDRHPDLVRGVVLGDSPLTPAGEGRFAQMVSAITAAGSMDAAASYVETFFVDATPEHIRAFVRATMLSCPAPVAAGMLESDAVFVERLTDLVQAADKKPFMAIWAESPLGDPDKLRDITTFLRQEPIPEAGHFFQLEQPAITNALLRAFIDDVERDPRI
jgi:pimeloyl-ACP methyl ester carboxylesterase